MTADAAPSGGLPLLDAGFTGSVRGAFTTRSGGGGAAPFDGLNLGDHVGDDPRVVAANRELVRSALGADALVLAAQVHSADVVVVDRPFPGPAPQADALVTSTPGVALAVLVADCVPVLLADPRAGVVGVAHAGRAGMAAGVVAAVVAAMRDLGARDLRAVTGPSVCGACYEVPEAMRAEVAAREPASWARTRRGTPALDVAAGVRAQLAASGVAAHHVEGCTVEDRRFFSHRREGRTGRFAGVVVLRAGEGR
ncbi:peptidoglycan editing factor PgeF [Kineococcus sp. NUM-3379]